MAGANLKENRQTLSKPTHDVLDKWMELRCHLDAGRHIATGIVVHESGRLYPEAIIFTTTAPKSLHDFESEVRRARRLDRTDPPQFDPLRAEILEEPNPVAK
jgi:hypothetical protein